MTATFVARLERAHALRRIARFLRLCRRASVAIAKWDSRARRRESLARLNDHLLTDIGLTREHQIVERSKLLYWLQ